MELQLQRISMRDQDQNPQVRIDVEEGVTWSPLTFPPVQVVTHSPLEDQSLAIPQARDPYPRVYRARSPA